MVQYSSETSKIARSSQGFTLIELMIAVAIVAILSSIAYPSYTSYIARAKRADVKSQLVQAAQFMQRFYTANDSYKYDRSPTPKEVSDQIPSQLTRSPSEGTQIYQLTIVADTNPPKYDLTFSPLSGTTMANDECGSFTLDSAGRRGVKVGGAVGSTALRDKCWK
jgi:type IV pilus assembly protein PilE